MQRREFLTKTGKALALAAVAGGAGILYHNRSTARYTPLAVRRGSFEVAVDPLLPKVALARNSDPIAALNYSLDAVGGIGRFVKPGEKVTIKPNIGWDRTPEQAANTNPILIAEMVTGTRPQANTRVTNGSTLADWQPACDLPAELMELLLDCTLVETDKRPGDAAALSARLQALRPAAAAATQV